MRWVNVFHIYQPPHWNAAVIRRVVRESYSPFVRFLTSHPKIRLTLNITGSLTDQLGKMGCRGLLRDLAGLGRRGQVEFLASAMYHPILPLLPPGELERQVKLNHETNRRWLGSWYRPRGFFPPEMAIDAATARRIARLGFRYLIIDEIAAHGQRSDRQTHMHRLKGSKLLLAFRYRTASDYIAFSATSRDLGRFVDLVSAGLRGDILLTAMDGENLGHHRRVTAQFWYAAIQRQEIVSMTMSDLVRRVHKHEPIEPRSSSWSTTEDDLKQKNPYPLWHDPKNVLHQLQWQLAHLVYQEVGRARHDPGFALARHDLDEVMSSDQYWWASQRPWWSAEIVQDAALRWLTVLARLSNVRDNTHARARSLAEAIIKRAVALTRTGEAERRRRAYLKSTQAVHFLGGQRVK